MAHNDTSFNYIFKIRSKISPFPGLVDVWTRLLKVRFGILGSISKFDITGWHQTELQHAKLPLQKHPARKN